MRKVYSVLISGILFFSCDHSRNSNYAGLDVDYCPPVDSSIDAVAEIPINRINVFLETSGSMAGYMPRSSPATEFQKVLPDVISLLNTKNNLVKFYSIYNSKTKFSELEIGNARNKILNGDFNWSGSTYLPVMLDSINHYLKEDVVNIFVSDAIYSPETGDIKEAELATTDIRDKISRYANTYSTFAVCLYSEYRRKTRPVKDSPYYLIIQGQAKKVETIVQIISQSISRNNQPYEDVNFGWNYETPFYSILPYTETNSNFTAEPCSSQKDAFVKLSDITLDKDSVNFWMGIDLKRYPTFVTNPSYLQSNLSLSVEDGAGKIVSIRERKPIGLDLDDQDLAARCTHFLKINLLELNTPVSQLSLSLKYARPDWVSYLNESELAKENERQKTFGLERILSAYEQAYMPEDRGFYFEDLKLSLIKD